MTYHPRNARPAFTVEREETTETIEYTVEVVTDADYYPLPEDQDG